jgi:hypothetical protein
MGGTRRAAERDGMGAQSLRISRHQDAKWMMAGSVA